jgi:hypothetical protein
LFAEYYYNYNRFDGEGKNNRMTELDAYRSIDDVRFKVCSLILQEICIVLVE